MNRPAFCFLAILAGGFFVEGNVALRAQVPAAEALQQQVNLRGATPPPEEATSLSSPDLGDIEAVQRYPKPETLSFYTQQEFFYTDNVFYTHHDEQGSSAYLGNYTGSFVPYSTRDWTPRVTLQYNMVRYFGVADADFDNENAIFSSQYVFGKDRSWTWTPSVTLSRYTEASEITEHEFYKEVVYDNQVAHTQKLLDNVPLYFVSAYDLAYHQTDPSAYNRLDNTLTFSLAWYPVPQVSISAFVRPSERIYFTDTPDINQEAHINFAGPVALVYPAAHIRGQHDRDDFNIATGIDVTWTPIKYLSVSADFDAANDYSNNSGLSYDQTSPGLSLTGSYKF
jgi:hypothetical protein